MTEQSLRPVIQYAATAFCLLLLITGCDNSIEPFDEQGTYSIYGVLYQSRDVQFIRVKPLSVPIGQVDSGSVNATVTFENLTKGTSTVLEDSIMTFKEGDTKILTHNYWTDAPITPKTKYRITVEGDAKEAVQTTTITPTSTDADLNPQDGGCNDTYTVVFEEVDDMRRIQAWVEIKFDHHLLEEWVSFPRNKTYRTSNGNIAVNFSPSSLLEELNKNPDIHVPTPDLPSDKNPFCWIPNICASLDSDQIRIRYAYLGPEWYGDIPEDSLGYNPLESHDVTNGLGFLGAVREDRISGTVDTSRAIWTGGRLCDEEPP